MSVLSVQITSTGQIPNTTGLGLGLSQQLPTEIYISTDDTLGTVLTPGYLNESHTAFQYPYNNYQLAEVYTTDNGGTTQWLAVSVSGTTYSLVKIAQAGTITTPTVANQIAYATNTGGTIAASGLATALFNAGNISAGLSGTAGKLYSFPATTAKGFLGLAAVTNSAGNFSTIISNASSVGETQVVTIIDSGAATANFILSSTAGSSQSITTGNLLVTAGNLQAGSPGNAGTVTSFPGTATEGSLVLAAVNNAGGNFNTTISNASSVGQAQVVSIPDGAAAASNFLISNSGGTQTIATGSLALTAGNIIATAGNVQAGSSGHAGTLTSFPGTATEGSLIVAAVNNAGGNFATTISNASSVGQAQVVSIPDGGVSTSNFITSNSAGTQHITSGSLQVDAGNISVGLATGGTAGTFISYSATSGKGALILAGVANTGNTNTTISNDAMGQASVVNIPDPGNAISQFLTAATATPFTSGNIPIASGTAGLMVDSGASATNTAVQALQVLRATTTLTAAQVLGALTTAVQLVPAPGAGKTIIPIISSMYLNVSGVQFAAGGPVILQYGNAAGGTGTPAFNAAIGANIVTQGVSLVYESGYKSVTSLEGITNLGIYFSNQSPAFTNGTGSTLTFSIIYFIVTATV